MKPIYLILSICLFALMMPAEVFSSEGPRNFQVHNRLLLEYDDNVRETTSDTADSFKIINEIEFLVVLNLENTHGGFRYKPQITWWEDREEDSVDMYHFLDAVVAHRFTPRVRLDLRNNLRYAQLPEAIDDGAVVRQRSAYLFNGFMANMVYSVTALGQLEGSARYNLLRYDDSDVASREDYDIYRLGLTYRHSLMPETSVSGDFRWETIEYDSEFKRDSDLLQLGLGVEHIFSPQLQGGARAGYHYRDYDDDALSSDNAPYFDVNAAYLPSPATRLTLGLGYSFVEADVFPYANQERFRALLGVAHDITSRLTVNVSGQYLHANYDAADALPAALDDEDFELDDGTETVLRLSTRISYQLNRSNWIEAGWTFSDMDSDLRDDFSRNRFNVGWTTRL